jgi:hypothetical protein
LPSAADRAFLAAALLAGCASVPQDKPDQPAPAEERKWELSAYAMAVAVPGQGDYLAPVVTADRGPLHLEARYNYEGHETGSVWVGRNFEYEDDVTVTVTPMAGLVFGDINGIAPGLRLAAAWWQLDVTSESEYVLDFEDHHDNFFYSWSELGWSPSALLRMGVVGQRTRVHRTEHEVDRGLFLQVSPGTLYFAVYAFEPWDNDRYWAFTAGTSF